MGPEQKKPHGQMPAGDRAVRKGQRRTAVRLGIPALIVAVLAFLALWRVGPPPQDAADVGTTAPSGAEGPPLPLTRLADILTENAVGREASLESVRVRDVTSPRTFWIGSPNEVPAFVVLDPDVKRTGGAQPVAGSRVTLIGLVRPAPEPARAIEQWQIDAATAAALSETGRYLHATEIRGE